MNHPQGLWGKETQHFHHLTPDHVLSAADSLGVRLTGQVLAMNSLENRVYDVELASNLDVGKSFSSNHFILKFYRPGRWSKEQILEEHEFLKNLNEFEVPVVCPLFFNGSTLHLHQETKLWFALFPKVLGRLKDELIDDEIDQAARLIGRIHNVGGMKPFSQRLSLNPDTFIRANSLSLKEMKPSQEKSFEYYLSLLENLYQKLSPVFSQLMVQRLHGDFHRGNIVWTSEGPFAVDFDDCLTGPIEQDLWLLFPGKDSHSLKERERFLDAYKEMTRRAYLQLNLTESLRAMRMTHFNAWITKRWDDHSFKRVFPQFENPNYWDQELLELRTQIALLEDGIT